MTRHLHTATFALAALTVLLSSCGSNRLDVPSAEIRFNAINAVKPSSSTKADQPSSPSAASAFDKARTFATYAYLLPAGVDWSGSTIAQAQTYIDNEKISFWPEADGPYMAGSWHGENAYYWPKSGSLTFYAHSPYAIPEAASYGCTKENGVFVNNFKIPYPRYPATVSTGTVMPVADDQVTDILVADEAKNLSRSSSASGLNAVPVLFRHVLSKVRIVATLDRQPSATDEPFTIKGITLRDICTSGSYGNAAWSSQGDVRDIEYKCNVTLDYDFKDVLHAKEVFPETFMIPQTTTAGTVGSGTSAVSRRPRILIKYTVGSGGEQTAEFDLWKNSASLGAWGSGKIITYTLVHILNNDDEYIEFGASLGDWVETDKGNVDIGNM